MGGRVGGWTGGWVDGRMGGRVDDYICCFELLRGNFVFH